MELFHQIGQEAGNRVVILTGAGEAFIDRIDAAGAGPEALNRKRDR